ncbi:MAG TPA: hypothetical protein VMV10_10735 [Pirellulales bacterium]|nr:hypothetical protein [Pirellulales bacterium]
MHRSRLGLTNIGVYGRFALAWAWLAAGSLCAAESLPRGGGPSAADAALFPPPPLPLVRDDRLGELNDRNSAPKPAAESAAATPADEHQFWLVNTRRLSSVPRDGQDAPEVRRYQSGAGWSDSSLDELLAAEAPQAATCVLVHGNHTDRQLAVSKGFEVYRTLVRGATNGQPVRLIVWSWPSDQIPGSYRADARAKARRTNVEAYYLAAFLDRLRGRYPVSLVGYSFGARVITGSLHLLGGGALASRKLEPRDSSSRPPFHAVLLAAAVDHDWLLEGRPHGRALSAVERLVVLVNPQDRVLRWYRFLAPGEGSEALGSRGLPVSARTNVDRKKLVQINVSSAVGNRHGWTKYIGSTEIVKRLQQETLVETSRRRRDRTPASSGTEVQAGGG